MLKSFPRTILSVLAISLLSTSTLAQVTPSTGVTSSTKNPLQIAILHWYDANLTTSFDAGFGPSALTFDGENIWGAGFSSNTVVKLRANDGKVLGTFGQSVLFQPDALAFDGANIWVANLVVGEGNVSKLRASDGKVLGTFGLGGGIDPFGLAFDGANIWVADFSSFTVTKLRASDGKVLGIFSAGPQPDAIVFDWANIWVTNYAVEGTVTKLRASDGKLLGTFAVSTAPIALVFDGANIWVTNGSMAFDGSNIWTAGDTATKLRASDGKVLGNFTLHPGTSSVSKL